MRAFCRVMCFFALFFAGTVHGVAAGPEPDRRLVSIVEPGEAVKYVGPMLDVLKDSSGTWTIDDVRRPDLARRFTPGRALPETGVIHVGYAGEVWWGRFTVHNPTARPIEQVVEFGYPTIDHLEFFRPSPDGSGYLRQITGDSIIGRSVDIPGVNPLYRVMVPAESSATYYVRISGDSLMAFDVRLYELGSYLAKFSGGYDPVIFFFGIIFAAAFYCFSIYAIVRDRTYLLFALLVVGIAGYFSSLWGYLSAYVLPETTWAANFIVSASTCLILVSMTRFTRHYLELNVFSPRIAALSRIYEVGCVLLLLISLVDFAFAQTSVMLFLFIGLSSTLALSVKLWNSGQKYKKFISLIWLYFCATALLLPLERFGVLVIQDFHQTANRVSFALICLMFAAVFAEQFRRRMEKKEKEVSIARDQAVAASQAKSRFLAMMSHELRTPLNAVIGFADIIRMESMGAIGNPKYREYAQDIRDSGSHLLAIINDLLEISRIEAGQIELVDEPIVIPGLVRRCLRIVEDRATENGLVLGSVVPEGLPALIGDENRIQQVLINLLYNAVKFTPAGGRIHLEVGLRDGAFHFIIQDTGIGIAEADRARILEPFAQVDSHLTRRHDGAGLGLAIAKSILDMHAAKLTISGAVGEGTTFDILFPKSRTERFAA